MADVSRRNKSLSMGQNTHMIPLELFSENRSRLVQAVQATGKAAEGSVIFLQGGESLPMYNTDVDYSFRQEPFFQWAFGVREPGCSGALTLSGSNVLFVPQHPDSYATWMGRLETPEEIKERYGVDRVEFVDDIERVLGELCEGASKTLLTLSGVNSDSKLAMAPVSFPGIEKFTVDTEILWPVATECRVIKSPKEIEAIRYSNKVSSEAHKLIMRYIQPGMYEYQCEAIFLGHCYYVGGCRHVSYTCICGSGSNSAILHYGHAAAPNDKLIKPKDMCLFDMGCSYFGYASDITCSFPASGKFTDDQKLIYNAVLDARNKVFELAKPGVAWPDMHAAAYRCILSALIRGGLLVGDVEEMLAAGLGAIFQPHGLGHLLGLDVHDVGGYPKEGPPRPEQPGFSSLRTARVLQAGMILTVEPGCYFIDKLLDDALASATLSRYLVPEVIQRFRGFGGVRIEDDVLITETGIENLTQVPRTVDEIEALMAEALDIGSNSQYSAVMGTMLTAV